MFDSDPIKRRAEHQASDRLSNLSLPSLFFPLTRLATDWQGYTFQDGSKAFRRRKNAFKNEFRCFPHIVTSLSKAAFSDVPLQWLWVFSFLHFPVTGKTNTHSVFSTCCSCSLDKMWMDCEQNCEAMSSPYGGSWCGMDTCSLRSGCTQMCKYAFGDIGVTDKDNFRRDEFCVWTVEVSLLIPTSPTHPCLSPCFFLNRILKGWKCPSLTIYSSHTVLTAVLVKTVLAKYFFNVRSIPLLPQALVNFCKAPWL